MPNSSHYETLKVPQSASLEAIRAAYKQLARQHHPDCNSNSTESHRQMLKLNAAFDVLADPIRRAAYDQSVILPARSKVNGSHVLELLKKWMQSRQATLATFVHSIKPVRRNTPTRWIARSAFVLLALWALNLDREPTLHADIPNLHSSGSRRTSKALTPGSRTSPRPAHAPNGSSWPAGAAEVEGYPVECNDGKSIITLDNSRNPSDVFVKLIGIEGRERTAVRHVYIPGHQTLECRNVRKGIYEIRYQDLGSGLMAKSGTFEVLEMKTDRTISFSSMRITLARVTDSTPDQARITAAEF